MTGSGGSPTKVVFLTNDLEIGGAETQLVRLAVELQARGWQVAVLTLRDEGPLGAVLATHGIEHEALASRGARAGVGALLALVRALRRLRPDCMITFLLQANLLGRLAGAWCGVPVVSSIRNVRFGGGSRRGARLADLLERLTNPLAKAVVVNSRLAADALLSRGVVRAATLRVVPNALGRVRPLAGGERAAARAALSLAPNDFVWLAVGRLEPQKNYGGLLAAFAALRTRHPEARLLVAGDGSLAEELADLAARLSLRPAVSFLGFEPDVSRLLGAADAFVLASEWEGLPNSVMEAMAAALPCVGTAVGGVPELIEDGVTGWLAASPDARDVAAAMERLMAAPPASRRTVALAARDAVHRRFGLHEVAGMWQAVVRETIGGREGADGGAGGGRR